MDKQLELPLSGADWVKKPPHYTGGNIECIDYIKDVLGPEGFIAFCQGNLIKYQHRHRHKGKRQEDLEKAKFYLEQMIKTTKEQLDK